MACCDKVARYELRPISFLLFLCIYRLFDTLSSPTNMMLIHDFVYALYYGHSSDFVTAARARLCYDKLTVSMLNDACVYALEFDIRNLCIPFRYGELFSTIILLSLCHLIFASEFMIEYCVTPKGNRPICFSRMCDLYGNLCLLLIYFFFVVHHHHEPINLFGLFMQTIFN